MGIRNKLKKLIFHDLGLQKDLLNAEAVIVDAWKGWSGSYSQSKEDIFAAEYFDGAMGFYIDIGANHPIKLSNTYLLYKKGWKGLTVEPIPYLYRLQKRFRPRDTQLNLGVGETSGKLEFFELLPNALSTFDAVQAAHLIKKGVILMSSYELKVQALAEIFNENVAGQKVDFLSIDTELFDLSVLKGNDWEKFRPQLVVCEADGSSEINNYMELVGYRTIKQIGYNTFFLKELTAIGRQII